MRLAPIAAIAAAAAAVAPSVAIAAAAAVAAAAVAAVDATPRDRGGVARRAARRQWWAMGVVARLARGASLPAPKRGFVGKDV